MLPTTLQVLMLLFGAAGGPAALPTGTTVLERDVADLAENEDLYVLVNGGMAPHIPGYVFVGTVSIDNRLYWHYQCA